MFMSFDPREAPPQTKLPQGGALISIVAQEKLPGRNFGNSLSEWATEDRKGIAAAGNPIITALELPPQTTITNAVISSFDTATFGPDDQAQHCVAAYWGFKSKLFAAYLYYVIGDPKAKAQEALFLQTLRSIRPLDRKEPGRH